MSQHNNIGSLVGILFILGQHQAWAITGPRDFSQYLIRRASPSASLVPFKQICCGYTTTRCGIECTAMNNNGYCCTAFTVGADGSCNLLDDGPDSWEPIPANDLTSERIYVKEGFQECTVAMIAGGTNGGSVNSVELYSPNGGCNFALAPLPIPLFANFLLGRYKNKIYACLGYSDQNGGDNRQCWQYFYANNTWAYLTQSVYIHRWRTPFIYKNYIYFIDGSNPEKYDMDTNQWSAGISAPYNPGNAPCMVVYYDSVFVLGGDGYSTGNQQYNFTTNAWKIQAYLPVGMWMFGCTLLPAPRDRLPNSPLYGDKIIMMQASNDDLGGTIYDIKNNVYLPMGQTAYGHRHAFIITLGRRVFVTTGWWGSALPYVEEYHPHNNTWTLAKNNIYPRWHVVSLAVPAHWFKNMTGGCQGVI